MAKVQTVHQAKYTMHIYINEITVRVGKKANKIMAYLS